MWKYVQSTGELFSAAGKLLERGYSGKAPHKNDPDKQCIKNSGPIPRGKYTIGEPVELSNPTRPFALPLSPDSDNDMCSPTRTGFYIHGDKVDDPGNASTGCIIMKKTTRETLNKSEDDRLWVIRESMLSKTKRRRIIKKTVKSKQRDK